MYKHFRVLLFALIFFAISPVGADAATPQIVTGSGHTCALLADGRVKCFGRNVSGQLGTATNNGTLDPNPTPTTVSLGAPASTITAGHSHSCVLLTDGAVKCFGHNYYGQLGSSTNNATSTANPTPTTVSLGAPASTITAGYGHTCALLTDGSVKCFGMNHSGQLGTTTNNGTLDPNPTPATVPLDAPATAIAAGSEHTCALLSDGGVKCFGRNTFGQLGTATNNGTSTANPTPTTVSLGAPASMITAGNHTCALLADGSAKCFGRNTFGQLGTATNNGTSTANPTPTTVSLGASASTITAGHNHTCALPIDGSAKCFGRNTFGQLGNSTNNSTNNPNPTPTTVSLGAPSMAITAGGDEDVGHTCAVLTDGSVKCFGDNSYGQLGSTLAGYSFFPLTVAGLTLFTPPPPPPPLTQQPPPPADRASKIASPKWKSVTKGRKLNLSGQVRVNAASMTAATCAGKLAVTVKHKRKKLASKRFALKFASGQCTARVRITLARRHDNKRVRITLALANAPALAAKTLVVTARL